MTVSVLSSQIVRTSVLSISEHKGSPRLWIEGKYLEKAGFVQGCTINISWTSNEILITLNASGERKVSGRRNTPIIDINNTKLLQIFKISDKVKAVVSIGEILITRTKKAIRKLTQVHDRSYGEVFCGGGLLSQAAKEAGFKSKWGIEQNSDYAEVWQANHNGTMFNCDIADVDLDELSKVELLIGGIPCEPFSIARRNQGIGLPEEHRNADLSMFFLMIVEKVNPKTIILEEVPAYIESGIGTATISALKRMGYSVDYKIFTGLDYGELETRRRVVIVATTDTEKYFPLVTPINFPIFTYSDRKMGEVLQKPDDPECEWFDRNTKGWIFEHWDKAESNGTNFQSQIISEESPSIQAITKRYFAIQPDKPVVKHPTKEGTYRLLTATEVKKLMGLSLDYQFPTSKTTMGEILGQGVMVKIFRKIIESVCGGII